MRFVAPIFATVCGAVFVLFNIQFIGLFYVAVAVFAAKETSIVNSYQNHTALARLAVLKYTVCDLPPCLILV